MHGPLDEVLKKFALTLAVFKNNVRVQNFEFSKSEEIFYFLFWAKFDFWRALHLSTFLCRILQLLCLLSKVKFEKIEKFSEIVFFKLGQELLGKS